MPLRGNRFHGQELPLDAMGIKKFWKSICQSKWAALFCQLPKCLFRNYFASIDNGPGKMWTKGVSDYLKASERSQK